MTFRLFLVCLFAATHSSSLAAQVPLRVMPLGDSITEARNGGASYRYFLWRSLQASGHCVDFVGSMKGVWQGKPKYTNFDQDHEGHWGWRADQILVKMPTWAKAAKPDVVLCHLGTNDIWQAQSVASTVTELGKIIDALRLGNAKVRVLLAQLIPMAKSTGVDLGALNKALVSLAKNKSTSASPVILVDHRPGFDPNKHTYDGVHPNEAGEKIMAAKWHAAIVAGRSPCGASVSKFGKGCAGSSGTPILAASSGSRPIVGRTFSVRLDSLPGSIQNRAFAILGSSKTVWSGIKLPYGLGPVGAPGCSLLAGMDYVIPLIKTGSTAKWSGTIPKLSPVSGIQFYVQGYALDPKRNGLGVVLSNGLMARIGLR